MADHERLFFSSGEALTAVCLALSRYSSQINLISGIWPLVFGSHAYVMPDPNRHHLWAKTTNGAKLVSGSEDDLKQLILDHLQKSPPTTRRLAQICSQVFGTATRAVPASPTAGGEGGVWIDTDMGAFTCVQCGHCCRTLNYREGCSLDDYRRWQKLGRDDILDWVGTIRVDGRVTACRIWMEPGTNRYAKVCPWLKQVDQSGRTLCTIHEIRPAVCRQYPGTRKHARLTGCGGV